MDLSIYSQKTTTDWATGLGGDGYVSSPERSVGRPPYEDPYYTQFLGPGAARPNIAPVIDEEAG